jgi:hypothetical protein
MIVVQIFFFLHAWLPGEKAVLCDLYVTLFYVIKLPYRPLSNVYTCFLCRFLSDLLLASRLSMPLYHTSCLLASIPRHALRCRRSRRMICNIPGLYLLKGTKNITQHRWSRSKYHVAPRVGPVHYRPANKSIYLQPETKPSFNNHWVWKCLSQCMVSSYSSW